ncbi:MAG: hypothetical protein B7733_06335 [Myxococcales bacterium FL481]|nr:MAG: hypothetical protein B7733_06335 [Myxococcales bacterium FL481]
MASGDPVVQILGEMPPDANFATLDTRTGGSTPAEEVTVWDFDASTVEYVDYKCRLHGYDGGGLTFRIFWMASTATADECRWEIAIRRVADDAEDVDSSHSYTYNAVDATAPSASGEVDYATITFTDGADMDSWADGEVAIVRLRRNASDAADDMTGDAELVSLVGEET